MSTDSPTATRDRIDPAAGELLKRNGMADTDETVDVAWADRCDAAIEEMARRRVPFQASDLIEQGLVGEPDKHQQWGPRFVVAAKRGVIREVAAARSNRKHTHRSLLLTWIGA